MNAYKIAGANDSTSDQLRKMGEKPEKIAKEIDKLKDKMKKLSAQLEFEEAAKIRDDIKRLQILDLDLRSDHTDGKDEANPSQRSPKADQSQRSPKADQSQRTAKSVQPGETKKLAKPKSMTVDKTKQTHKPD